VNLDLQIPEFVSQTMKYLKFTGTFQKNLYTDMFKPESEATNVLGQVQAKKMLILTLIDD